MLPITLGSASFKYGPYEIPYGDVSGAGIAVQRGRVTVHRSLLIGYRLPGDPKHRKILFGLKPGAEGEQLAGAFRAQVADRWKGEADLFEMNKRLGFSNKLVFGIVGGIVVVTVLAVVGVLAVSVKAKNENAAPRRPDTSTRAPGR